MCSEERVIGSERRSSARRSVSPSRKAHPRTSGDEHRPPHSSSRVSTLPLDPMPLHQPIQRGIRTTPVRRATRATFPSSGPCFEAGVSAPPIDAFEALIASAARGDRHAVTLEYRAVRGPSLQWMQQTVASIASARRDALDREGRVVAHDLPTRPNPDNQQPTERDPIRSAAPNAPASIATAPSGDLATARRDVRPRLPNAFVKGRCLASKRSGAGRPALRCPRSGDSTSTAGTSRRCGEPAPGRASRPPA